MRTPKQHKITKQSTRGKNTELEKRQPPMEEINATVCVLGGVRRKRRQEQLKTAGDTTPEAHFKANRYKPSPQPKTAHVSCVYFFLNSVGPRDEPPLALKCVRGVGLPAAAGGSPGCTTAPRHQKYKVALISSMGGLQLDHTEAKPKRDVGNAGLQKPVARHATHTETQRPAATLTATRVGCVMWECGVRVLRVQSLRLVQKVSAKALRDGCGRCRRRQ